MMLLRSQPNLKDAVQRFQLELDLHLVDLGAGGIKNLRTCRSDHFFRDLIAQQYFIRAQLWSDFRTATPNLESECTSREETCLPA